MTPGRPEDVDSAVRLQTARPSGSSSSERHLEDDFGSALSHARRDRPTIEPPPAPPGSNRLSDAPSAPNEANRDETRFFEEVKPSDLSAVFQPIVNLATGSVFAYEALVRCRVPRFASPPVLFEHAGASRATGRLGRMIRESRCRSAAGLPLFVNLHPNELEEGLARPPGRPDLFARPRHLPGDHRVGADHALRSLHERAPRGLQPRVGLPRRRRPRRRLLEPEDHRGSRAQGGQARSPARAGPGQEAPPAEARRVHREPVQRARRGGGRRGHRDPRRAQGRGRLGRSVRPGLPPGPPWLSDAHHQLADQRRHLAAPGAQALRGCL